MAGTTRRRLIDTTTLVLVGLTTTLALWVVTYIRQPDARSIALRGVAIAMGVAAVLALGVAAVATLLLRYEPTVALFAGAVVGAGFLWHNLVLLAIGLWFKPTRSWAVGACLATPVILAAIGFGYAAYRAWPL